MRSRTVSDLAEALAGEWRKAAACSMHGHPHWWDDDQGGDPDLVEAARHICRGCPVRTPCLVDALERDERHTIRGAFTADERRALDLTDLDPNLGEAS